MPTTRRNYYGVSEHIIWKSLNQGPQCLQMLDAADHIIVDHGPATFRTSLGLHAYAAIDANRLGIHVAVGDALKHH